MQVPSSEAEPPAYVPVSTDPWRGRRSIVDLRTQIIANGSVLKPRQKTERPSDDHIEVIVARSPGLKSSQASSNALHWSEKQAMDRGERLNHPLQANTVTTLPAVASSSSSAASAAQGAQHYAVLCKRSTSGYVNIILKGQQKDTPEEALEWVLEQTEMMVHDLVIRRGRPATDTCCVM